MRWLTLFITLLYVGCQPSYSQPELEFTPKSCEVAVYLAKRSLAMYRANNDQFDVMVMLNNYDVSGNSEAYVGKVYTQVMTVDLKKNVYKAFKDEAIIKQFATACTKRLGLKIPKGK